MLTLAQISGNSHVFLDGNTVLNLSGGIRGMNPTS